MNFSCMGFQPLSSLLHKERLPNLSHLSFIKRDLYPYPRPFPSLGEGMQPLPSGRSYIKVCSTHQRVGVIVYATKLRLFITVNHELLVIIPTAPMKEIFIGAVSLCVGTYLMDVLSSFSHHRRNPSHLCSAHQRRSHCYHLQFYMGCWDELHHKPARLVC